MHFRRDDFRSAIEDITECLRRDPENSQHHHYRGLAYGELAEKEPDIAGKHLRMAEADLARAMELRSNPGTARELDRIRKALRKWEEGK